MRYSLFTLLLAGLFLFAACGNDDDSLSEAEQLTLDLEIIDTYLTANNLTTQSTDSGLHYIIEEEGTGELPDADQPIIFQYSGSFTDGSFWAESFYGPEVFWLLQTPPGFQEGIPMFKIGSKGKIILPSALAFGPQGSTTVPPNSVMIFDIELPELCLSDSTFASKQACLDDIKINQYLTENNLTAEKSASGLYYIIEDEGIGNALPTLADEVKVLYTGYLLDDTVFDQTVNNTPVEFVLSGVIEGWKEGIRLFKKEGKGKLFIPSAMAYGSSPPDGSIIPSNAVLIFDIELLDF